jgi:hypothetical protein
VNDLTAERTPHVIAAEINMINHQTKKILLPVPLKSAAG